MKHHDACCVKRTHLKRKSSERPRVENQRKYCPQQSSQIYRKREHRLRADLIIRTNHQTYRFIYSTLINTIYYFVNEEHIQNQFIQRFTGWQANAQGGWISQPQPLQYPNVAVKQKPTNCPREVDKFTKGLNKKRRDRERKIVLEQRLTEITALAKKHKDSEKEFQNSNLILNFKL